MGGMRLRTDYSIRDESAAERVLRTTGELMGGMVAFISRRLSCSSATAGQVRVKGGNLGLHLAQFVNDFGLEHPQLMQELRRSGATKIFKQHPHLFMLKATDRGWAPRGSPNSDLSAVHGTQSLKQIAHALIFSFLRLSLSHDQYQILVILLVTEHSPAPPRARATMTSSSRSKRRTPSCSARPSKSSAPRRLLPPEPPRRPDSSVRRTETRCCPSTGRVCSTPPSPLPCVRARVQPPAWGKPAALKLQPPPKLSELIQKAEEEQTQVQSRSSSCSESDGPEPHSRPHPAAVGATRRVHPVCD